jgi:UDP-2-acetamido-2-deoxy-ribo-hexuluronate aminotransferase
MQFIDLAYQQSRIKDQINDRIQSVLKHGKYIMGPEVKELEESLAGYVGMKHGIACSSGTDALLLALLSFGIGPGDAVLTVPFTFIATAEVISLLGATPVFVDIDPISFNLDPEKLPSAIHQAESLGLTPKGIIPVNIFGLTADYDRINAFAKDTGLFVLEDAAQSFGAEYKGRKACSLGDITSTSFFPAKPLGCYGDGGMSFTNDDDLAEKMRSFLVHGKGTHKYDNTRIGINARLDTLQAAILMAKFDIFPEEVELRQEVALRYSELFDKKGDKNLTIPLVADEYKSGWAQYSILAKDENHRAIIQKALSDAGIPTAIYYPTPLHLQTAFKSLGYKAGDFSISEDCSQRVFSVPMHPYLSIEDQQNIVSKISSDTKT